MSSHGYKRNRINNKKIVVFGAGKIGRSFIAQLFSRGGYEAVFIDINKSLINQLNTEHNYKIIIKGEKEEVINVTNVRGIHRDSHEEVGWEVATSAIMAVSVGLEGLSGTFPLIAAGLVRRYEYDSNTPLDIIIAENIRNGASFFKKELAKFLPKQFPIDDYVGLIETSIGKMVPIMLKKDLEEDMLQVFAEPYNTLILDKKGFKNPIPDIPGLSPEENIKAWVDRKLFIHNLGHASAAYSGHLFNPEFTYIYEALAVPEIHRLVRGTMLQSADHLLARYPGEFTRSSLTDHIDDLLSRFQNRALGDTIFRVGCDLFRKLGPQDRLAGGIKMAIDLKEPYDKILFILLCAFRFRGVNEEGKLFPGDAEFIGQFNGNTESILTKVCGFDYVKEKEVFTKALEMTLLFQKNDFRSLIQNMKVK